MKNILIAGIGGASLGVEIAKSLRLAGGYNVFGCDISPLAFGHYSGQCDRTFVISRDRYIDALLDVCTRQAIDVVVAGGDQPARLLAADSARIAKAGVRLAGNSAEVVSAMADKAQCFERLRALGIRIPRTVSLDDSAALADAPVPAVIKPSSDSGGSTFVFFARNREEVALYAAYLRNNGLNPIAQEYLPHEPGEFTVGVLSSPGGEVEGAVVLRRSFHVKLSVMAKGNDFLISSGYSQGYIGPFPQIAATAISIAQMIGSRGPINVQGRFDKDGEFVPFEINPRFSASTYLRALAGFNEVDHHIRQLCGLRPVNPLAIKSGWYLRGLNEVAVPEGEILK